HATESVRLARHAQLPLRLGAALTILARVSRHNDPTAAERAIGEVIDMAPETVGAMVRGWALQTRAELRAAAGDTRGALSSLRDALAVFGHDATALTVGRISRDAAVIFADLGDANTAAIFAGAATAGPHARLLLYFLDEQTRSDLRRTVERLHSTLAADVYETEAARGTEMTTDDLVRALRHAVDGALVRTTN